MTMTYSRCPDGAREWRRLLAGRLLDSSSETAHVLPADAEPERRGHEFGPSSSRVLDCEDGGPMELEQALEHRRHCSKCQRASLVADPTLLFSDLPRVELSSDEVESMRERVAGVRRARSLGSPAGPTDGLSGRASRAHFQRAWVSAAAVLLSAALFAISWQSWTTAPQVEASAVASRVVSQLTVEDEARLETLLASQPLVDGLESWDTGQDLVMQVASNESDLVWVVDAELEL